MKRAARSVSRCPASASSAIELITTAVVSSATKNPVRITAAVIILDSRASVCMAPIYFPRRLRGFIRDTPAAADETAQPLRGVPKTTA
jgi:hypothetical protein